MPSQTTQTINTLTILLPKGVNVNLQFFDPGTPGAPQADVGANMKVDATTSPTVFVLNPKGHGPHPMKDAIC
jgi:hypothetical protein